MVQGLPGTEGKVEGRTESGSVGTPRRTGGWTVGVGGSRRTRRGGSERKGVSNTNNCSASSIEDDTLFNGVVKHRL